MNKSTNISLDLNSATHTVNNFWNHIHFHPTDAIEDGWGKAILEAAANDKVAKRIRIYAMLEDIVYEDVNGNLAYNFAENDARIDFLVKKGVTLLICFLFMPKAIAKDKSSVSVLKRYKGKKVYFSAPKDYALWGEVCYRYTLHLAERYGIDTVCGWYFHCWNEPDHVFWLNNTPVTTDCPEKANEYIKLYDYFATAVARVSPKIKVGGPSSGGNIEFIKAFAKHIAQNNNLATGKKGIKFDFLSLHTYKKYSRTNPSVLAKLEQVHEYNDIFKEYGIAVKEIIIDEWGVNVDGHKTVDQVDYLEFRETPYFSAFFAKLIKEFSREITNGLPVTHLMLCLSGQHDSLKNFDGHRSFFTRDGIKKPIYNAYSMCSALGNEYYNTEYSGTVGSFVTKNKDGYSVLLFNMCDDFYLSADTAEVKLNLNGFIKGEYKIKKQIIDDTHSCGYGEYKRMGAPEKMTKEQLLRVKAAAELYTEETNAFIKSEYSLSVTLNNNSTVLIKFTKV